MVAFARGNKEKKRSAPGLTSQKGIENRSTGRVPALNIQYSGHHIGSTWPADCLGIRLFLYREASSSPLSRGTKPVKLTAPPLCRRPRTRRRRSGNPCGSHIALDIVGTGIFGVQPRRPMSGLQWVRNYYAMLAGCGSLVLAWIDAGSRGRSSCSSLRDLQLALTSRRTPGYL